MIKGGTLLGRVKRMFWRAAPPISLCHNPQCQHPPPPLKEIRQVRSPVALRLVANHNLHGGIFSSAILLHRHERRLFRHILRPSCAARPLLPSGTCRRTIRSWGNGGAWPSPRRSRVQANCGKLASFKDWTFVQRWIWLIQPQCWKAPHSF